MCNTCICVLIVYVQRINSIYGLYALMYAMIFFYYPKTWIILEITYIYT